MFRKEKNKLGQSLFELLFAVAIIALIVVAIVGLSNRSISNESFSQNRGAAAEYAQQANEWIRSERDADWTIFSGRASASPGTTYCLKDLSWPTSGPCGSTNNITGTIFYREATLISSASDTISVTMVVSWSDTQGSHEVRSYTDLTNWRK